MEKVVSLYPDILKHFFGKSSLPDEFVVEDVVLDNKHFTLPHFENEKKGG